MDKVTLRSRHRPLLKTNSFEGKIETDYDYDEFEDAIVSSPFSVEHNVHVDFDSSTGFTVSSLFFHGEKYLTSRILHIYL